jgi:hypothetical protein
MFVKYPAKGDENLANAATRQLLQTFFKAEQL